jgi:putative spermidine/putrescine transport system substrate-binding protein
MRRLMTKRILGTIAAAGLVALPIFSVAMPVKAQTSGHEDCNRVRNMSWDELLKEAKGQTVNWWMWAGDPGVNKYVDEWVAQKAKELFGITVKRVAIKDTVEGVQQVISEKQAGKHEGGSVDLNWISSENLKTMIQGKMLCEDYQKKLPNAKYIDYTDPSVAFHGTLPIGDTATPWGRYQYVYVYNTEHIKDPIPKSFNELAALIKKYPGKFTYPSPPDFTGRGMLNNIMYEVTGGVDQWIKTKEFDKELWEKKSCAIWDYLNDIKPHLWRKGETYPENVSAQNRLYASGELWFTINAYHAIPGREVSKGVFPKGTKTSIVEIGTIAGTHNVSIPYNSSSKAAALVMSDFLIGPESQYQKMLPNVWGIGTVLVLDRLSNEWREKFRTMPIHPATVDNETLGTHQVPTPAHYHVPVEKGWRDYVLKGKSYSCN